MEIDLNQQNGSSERISADTAQDYLDNYVNVCIEAGEDPSKILKAMRVDRDAVEAILEQEDCEYIRIYLGKKTAGTELNDYQMMIVGVDSTNANLLADDEIYDHMNPCPNVCPPKHFK